MKLLFKCVLVVILPFGSIQAQNNVGVKFFGLSIHPKGEQQNAHLMPNKLDKNGYLVMNFGGEIMCDFFMYKDIFSVKIVQGFYVDCATKFGGFSHIGLRGRIIKKGKHSLVGGIGPTLVFRRNWLELQEYVNPNRFKGELGEKYQYLFLWYGGEFEYKYSINQNLDFAISFIPGYPDLMSLAVGVSYKFK